MALALRRPSCRVRTRPARVTAFRFARRRLRTDGMDTDRDAARIGRRGESHERNDQNEQSVLGSFANVAL